MNLFDKFKKKLTTKTISQKSTEELNKEYEDVQHNSSPTPFNRERYGIAPEEISFLEYASGHETDLSTFSKKFYYDYNLDYAKTIDFLLLNGFLRYSTPPESLKLYNVQCLKDYLKKINQPVSGNKNALIARIIESSTNFEEFFSKKCYMLTDKGISIINQFKIDNKVPRTEKEKLNADFKYYSQQVKLHLSEGNLGLYACDLYNLSQIHCKEKHYSDQLHLLILSAYIHLSGVDTLEDYNYWKDGDFSIIKPIPLLPPAVIRSTQKCMKCLEIDLDEYKKLFKKYICINLTPAHVFGIEKSLEIICSYLDGDYEKADKIVLNETKKYIKDFSAKKNDYNASLQMHT